MAAKKITLEELSALMADPKTTSEDLKPYFRVNEAESDPFAPAIEIDPDVSNGSVPVDYTSIVYVPPKPDQTRRWQTYDATSEGGWFASGQGGAVTGCTGASLCGFDELKGLLIDKARLEHQLQEAETEWLAASEALENAEREAAVG